MTIQGCSRRGKKCFCKSLASDAMKTIKERELWATAFCRKAGMRLTPVRQAILAFLAQQRMPVSLEALSQAAGIRGHCDSSTVYRTLMLFQEAELVRLVPTPQKASYFVLNTPGDTAHFLVCRQCGRIAELPLPNTTSAQIGRLASRHGFSPAPQACEIHALCADCQIDRSRQITPSKLSSGNKTKLRPRNIS